MMAALFIYLIKSSICLLLFWVMYRLLLGGTTFFRLNRLVLTGGTLICLLLPFVQLDIEEATPVQEPFLRLEEVLTEAPLPVADVRPMPEIVPEPVSPSWQPMQWLPVAYGLGVLVAVTGLLVGYVRFIRLVMRSRRLRAEIVTWCLIPGKVKPCSLGRYVVISEADYGEDSLVALHELMHVARRHFIDNTLMQLVRAVLWFNPVAHLLLHELKQLQEFQVDRDVCRQSVDSRQYQLLLVKKAVGAHLYALASGFSQPPLTKRITMMKQQETRKWRMWLTLLFLPAGAGVVYAFSQPESKQEIERFVEEDLQIPQEIKALPFEEKVCEIAESSSDDREPEEAPVPSKAVTTPQEPASQAPEAKQPEAPLDTPTPEQPVSARPAPVRSDSVSSHPYVTAPKDDKQELPWCGATTWLTEKEYKKIKKKLPFVTIYIDNSEQLRLEDVDGTFHPTSYRSFEEDVKKVLIKSFSHRYLNHLLPYAPGIRIVASIDEQYYFISEIQHGLISIIYYSGKEIQKRHPMADLTSLQNPTVYQDIPGLEDLEKAPDLYDMRFPKSKVTLKDKDKNNIFCLENFTGRELEAAMKKFREENPDVKECGSSLSVSLYNTYRNTESCNIVVREISKKYPYKGPKEENDSLLICR